MSGPSGPEGRHLGGHDFFCRVVEAVMEEAFREGVDPASNPVDKEKQRFSEKLQSLFPPMGSPSTITDAFTQELDQVCERFQAQMRQGLHSDGSWVTFVLDTLLEEYKVYKACLLSLETKDQSPVLVPHEHFGSGTDSVRFMADLKAAMHTTPDAVDATLRKRFGDSVPPTAPPVENNLDESAAFFSSATAEDLPTADEPRTAFQNIATKIDEFRTASQNMATKIDGLRPVFQNMATKTDNPEYRAALDHFNSSAQTWQNSVSSAQKQMESLLPGFDTLNHLFETAQALTSTALSPQERQAMVLSTMGEISQSPAVKEDPVFSGFLESLPAKILQLPQSHAVSFQGAPTKDKPPFIYSSLTSQNGIRLLRFETKVLPGMAEEEPEIVLSMEEVDINSSPKFYALSYVWGDYRTLLSQSTQPERIGNQFPICCNGRRLNVTHNLLCCLLRLYKAAAGPLKDVRDSYLWIDQLCINQQDQVEKEVQVSIMDDIYTRAATVVAWIGESDFQLEAACRTLKKLTTTPSSIRISTQWLNDIAQQDWLALGSLLSRPYFSRVWIVQELALPDDILVVCGGQCIEWNDLERLSEFLSGSDTSTMLSKYIDVYRSKDEQLSQHPTRVSKGLVDQMSALVTARKAIRGNVSSFQNLLVLGRQFDATNIIDKYYAMLGMFKRCPTLDSSILLPFPDYSLSLKDAAINFSRYHLKSTKRLGLLSLVGDIHYRTTDGEALPSWIPDPASPLLPFPLDETAFAPMRDIDWQPSKPFSKRDSAFVTGDKLFADGIELDKIIDISIPFDDATEERCWHRIIDFLISVHSSHKHGLSFGKAVWHTLTMCPDRPLGKSSTMADLDAAFGEWCISLLADAEYPNDILTQPMLADGLSSMHSLDDFIFDATTFPRHTKAAVATRGDVDHQESIKRQILLGVNAIQKRDLEMNTYKKSAKSLESSLVRLWELDKLDIFPALTRINSVRRILSPAQPETESLQGFRENVSRFKAALGQKLAARRLFVTKHGRLGLGPRSLGTGDEIWFLHGARIPFVLRPKASKAFQLLGQAYVFGAMHGESLQSDRIQLTTIRLV